MVRQHDDQMIRTRNFRARNERIETGGVVKSHKGRTISVEEWILGPRDLLQIVLLFHLRTGA